MFEETEVSQLNAKQDLSGLHFGLNLSSLLTVTDLGIWNKACHLKLKITDFVSISGSSAARENCLLLQ